MHSSTFCCMTCITQEMIQKWQHCTYGKLGIIQNRLFTIVLILSDNLELRRSYHQIRVLSFQILSETCSTSFIPFPRTICQALSNGIVKFLIAYALILESRKYCILSLKFQHQIRMTPPQIGLEAFSRCSNAISSTTRWALLTDSICFREAPT